MVDYVKKTMEDYYKKFGEMASLDYAISAANRFFNTTPKDPMQQYPAIVFLFLWIGTEEVFSTKTDTNMK